MRSGRRLTRRTLQGETRGRELQAPIWRSPRTCSRRVSALLKQTRRDEPPICHPLVPCAGCCPSRRRRPGRRRGHRPDPGRGRAATSATAPTSTSRRAKQTLAGAPAPLAGLHAQANKLIGGGKAAFDAAARRAEGPPGRDQQVGVVVRALPGRVPGLPVGRAPSAARRSRSSASTATTRTRAAKRFLAKRPLPVPVLHGPGRGDRAATLEAPTSYPMTVFVDRDGKTAYIHSGPYKSDDAARPTTSTATSAECRRSASTRSRA